MHIALSVEEGKRYGPAFLRAKQPREGLHFGKPHCSAKSPRQTRKVIPEGVSQKKKKKKKALFRFSALRYLWATFFPPEVITWNQDGKTSEPKSLSQLYPVPSRSQNGSCAPCFEATTYLLSRLLERKERKLCFTTDLAIWNSPHHPFLGLKLLSLKVPSHCALYQWVLEKSWIAYVQNCF